MPQCSATTKAGNPCQSPTVGADGLCAAHGKRIPVLTPENAAKGRERSKQVRQQRAISLAERLHRDLERHAADVAAAYLAGIRSDDERVRIQAAEAWLSRVYGRPTERVETADTTELSRLTNLTEQQLLKLRSELEADNVVPLPKAAGGEGQQG